MNASLISLLCPGKEALNTVSHLVFYLFVRLFIWVTLKQLDKGDVHRVRKKKTLQRHTHMHTNTRFLSKMSQDIQILPYEYIIYIHTHAYFNIDIFIVYKPDLGYYFMTIQFATGSHLYSVHRQLCLYALFYRRKTVLMLHYHVRKFI